jgi:hypothetical protein
MAERSPHKAEVMNESVPENTEVSASVFDLDIPYICINVSLSRNVFP